MVNPRDPAEGLERGGHVALVGADGLLHQTVNQNALVRVERAGLDQALGDVP